MTAAQEDKITELTYPILRSSQFPQMLRRLNDAWQEEQQRRAEFYNWVTPDVKAEFIEGEIIVHSPVRSKHNTVLGNISRLISIHTLLKKLGYVGVEKVMCEFPRNSYEPDLVFFDKTTAATIDEEMTIFPIPQLIVEVLSRGTEDRDRGVKLEDYQANGVGEYWIVNAYKNTVEQYVLREGVYQLIAEHTVKDTLESTILTGFSAPVRAFFDEQTNLTILQEMMR